MFIVLSLYNCFLVTDYHLIVLRMSFNIHTISLYHSLTWCQVMPGSSFSCRLDFVNLNLNHHNLNTKGSVQNKKVAKILTLSQQGSGGGSGWKGQMSQLPLMVFVLLL